MEKKEIEIAKAEGSEKRALNGGGKRLAGGEGSERLAALEGANDNDAIARLVEARVANGALDGEAAGLRPVEELPASAEKAGNEGGGFLELELVEELHVGRGNERLVSLVGLLVPQLHLVASLLELEGR